MSVYKQKAAKPLPHKAVREDVLPSRDRFHSSVTVEQEQNPRKQIQASRKHEIPLSVSAVSASM